MLTWVILFLICVACSAIVVGVVRNLNTTRGVPAKLSKRVDAGRSRVGRPAPATARSRGANDDFRKPWGW